MQLKSANIFTSKSRAPTTSQISETFSKYPAGIYSFKFWQWKQQNKLWNLLKTDNNNSSRSGIFIAEFKQVNASLVDFQEQF